MKKDLLILILLILPTFAPLVQKGYFSMHDDLQSMRQYQLDKCFKDGQIPCRWVSDMGYGYGYPLFNFYPPLPYLVGHLYRLLGFAYIDVVKLVGITAFILTAVFMYMLGKEFWGRLGGIVASAFYTYAPYHSVDFYVRGAINEFWAMCFYPLIFWTTYRLIKSVKNTSGVTGWAPPRWIAVTALSVAGLMLSHNPMLMIFAPVYLLWIVYWWWQTKSLASFKYLFLSALWSAGLAAFFTLPVVFEQQYVSVWTLTSGYFNYLAHYLSLSQIFFNINWGYGSSELGPADSMSFALGHLHWIIPLVILVLMPFINKIRDQKYLILFLVSCILISLFMAHSKSTPLWIMFKPLEFLQFPWRFLTLAVFAASFLSGAIAKIFSPKLVALLVFILILLNGNYFHPREWFPEMTDSKKFSGKSWQLLVTSGIFDYLPIWAPQPPADPAGGDINLTQGVGDYQTVEKKSNSQKYLVDVKSNSAVAELQTYYFPGWKVWLDGKEQSIDPKRDKLLGRIQVDIQSGTHTIEAKFQDTPIRTFANLLSILAWSGFGLLIIFQLIKHTKLSIRKGLY